MYSVGNTSYLDSLFEFDMAAAKRYSDADLAGRKAASRVSGRGNSGSVAYAAAYTASLRASFDERPARRAL